MIKKKARELTPDDIGKHVSGIDRRGLHVAGWLRQLYATADEIYLDINLDGDRPGALHECPMLFDEELELTDAQ